VALLVASGNVVWSLAGIAMGEVVFGLGIWQRARRLGRSGTLGPS
jgi:hypothetical protein